MELKRAMDGEENPRNQAKLRAACPRCSRMNQRSWDGDGEKEDDDDPHSFYMRLHMAPV